MHRRISSTLNALRQDLTAKLGSDVIHAACRAAGHTWRASALLTPAAIIHWFLIQVFHGNTALNHVTLMAGRAFTDSAFCLARARLPLVVFRAVLRAVIHALVPDTQAHGRWLGLRPFLLDGSSFSMPDTPVLQAHFGHPVAGGHKTSLSLLWPKPNIFSYPFGPPRNPYKSRHSGEGPLTGFLPGGSAGVGPSSLVEIVANDAD